MADKYPETMLEALLFSLQAILPASIFISQVLLAALVLFSFCIFPGLPRFDIGLAAFITGVLCFVSFIYELAVFPDRPYTGPTPGVGRVAMVAFVRAYVLSVVLVLAIRVAEFVTNFLQGSKTDTTTPAPETATEKKDA